MAFNVRQNFATEQNFEDEFWESFTGEMRLEDLLSHFVTRYPNHIDVYKEIFATAVIGKKLIEKKIDSEKLIDFVEQELSKSVNIKTKTQQQKISSISQNQFKKNPCKS